MVIRAMVALDTLDPEVPRGGQGWMGLKGLQEILAPLADLETQVIMANQELLGKKVRHS